MTIRPRTPSLFRPKKSIDQGVLTENRKLVDDINRRGLLGGAVSLGALTMLTGCDVSEIDSVQTALRAVSSWNDGVQAAIFRANHLAPTFSPSQVMKPPRFNAYYDIERFGLRFVASPRHADVLMVTGPVTKNMRDALERTYHATPDPKWVVAIGDCARDGGCFAGSYAVVGGVSAVIPVDLHIPGCPPTPTAMLQGLLALLEQVDANAVAT